MERISRFRGRVLLLLFIVLLGFFAFSLYDVQIIQTGCYHGIGFVQTVKILDLTAGLEGVVKELGLDPAGIHGHHADAPLL